MLRFLNGSSLYSPIITSCKNLSSCNPEPDLLDPIPGVVLRPHLRIKRSLPGPDIRLMGLDELGPLEDLPEKVEAQVDGDADVRGDEVLHAPVRAAILVVREDREAVEDDDDDEKDKGDVGGVGLEAGFEDEVGVAVDVLGDEGFAEAQVGDEDADPGEERCDCSKRLEPVEDRRGTGADCHEGEEADAGSYKDAL